MGFVKSYEELGRTTQGKGGLYEFYNAEMLTVMWETKREIVKRILPPPLKPTRRPLAKAFVAYYPKTNFCPSYYEAGLFLRATFKGVKGNYCLAMPVTNDMAMAVGREEFGYPKKLANIEFKRSGNSAKGHIERHGLLRERVILRPSLAKWGEAEVTLSPSDYDPWAEVEIVKMLGAVYTVGNNTMLRGSVVAEADPVAFAPYSLLKWDWWPVDGR
jgi:acetoacetate decarboxylase